MPTIKIIHDSIYRSPHSETQWTYIDDNPLALIRELQDLYLLGVERDMHDMISTLQIWQQKEYKDIIPSGPSLEVQDWAGFNDFVRRASGDDSTAM